MCVAWKTKLLVVFFGKLYSWPCNNEWLAGWLTWNIKCIVNSVLLPFFLFAFFLSCFLFNYCCVIVFCFVSFKQSVFTIVAKRRKTSKKEHKLLLKHDVCLFFFSSFCNCNCVAFSYELNRWEWTNFYACKAHFAQSNCFFVSDNYTSTVFSPCVHFLYLIALLYYRKIHSATLLRSHPSVRPSVHANDNINVIQYFLLLSLALHHLTI